MIIVIACTYLGYEFFFLPNCILGQLDSESWKTKIHEELTTVETEAERENIMQKFSEETVIGHI